MSWRDSALCTQVDGDLFYPEMGKSIREAISVCRSCEVRQACLDAALASPWEEYGVWGGTSMRERRRMRMSAGGARRVARAPEFCTAGDCNRKHHARGLCRLHYQRSRMERAS